MVLPPLPRKLLTLAFVVRNFPQALSPAQTASPLHSAVLSAAEDATCAALKPEVLLGLKKRGFGTGKWNGFGGKVDATDASIVAAAARELHEEANVVVEEEHLEERGILMFTFEGGKEILEVHVFLTDKFTGEPAESDEMRPQWYNGDAIPFDKMWQDDHIWLPHVLRGKAVYGHFHFAQDEDTMLHHEIDVMEP